MSGIENYPTKIILGEKCWSPKIAADALGASKATILNWIHNADNGIKFYSRGKGARIWIVVDSIIQWYEYDGQN